MSRFISNERELFKSKILEFLEKNNGFFSAYKISVALEIPEKIRGHNNWGTHSLCLELLKEGKITQKKGKGFKYLNKEEKEES